MLWSPTLIIFTMFSYWINRVRQAAGSGCLLLLQRAILYFIKRLFKQYTHVTEDQIGIKGGDSDLSISLTDVPLFTKELNKTIAGLGHPYEIVDGFVGSINGSIPWQKLGIEASTVHIKDVDITLRPKAVCSDAPLLVDRNPMNSMMQESMQEVLAEDKGAKDRGANASGGRAPKAKSEPLKEMKELQDIARLIENVKTLIFVKVENITIRLENIKSEKNLGLDIRIRKVEYFDDRVKIEVSREERESTVDPEGQGAWITKNIRVYDMEIRLDDDASPHVPMTPPDSVEEERELFLSALDHVSDKDQEEQSEADSHVRATPVTIAMLAGRSDVKIKLKREGGGEGVKMDMDGRLGVLYSLLTPKQVQFTTQILTPFVTPSKQTPRSSQAMALNQPMGRSDYERVNQALMRNMKADHFEDVTEPLAVDCNYLADGEPMFFTMEAKAPSEMNLSAASLDTTGTDSTRATSAFPSSTAGKEKQQREKERAAQKERDHAAKAAGDPSAECSRYQVSLAALAVCVLHEEPHDGSREGWVAKMQTLTNTYFEGARRIALMGHAGSLTRLRDQISTILPRDHLGLLCKPLNLVMADRTVTKAHSFSMDLKIHSAELVECLFDSRKSSNSFSEQEPASVPQYCEILTFRNTKAATSVGDFSAGSILSNAIAVNYTSVSKEGLFGRNYEETKVRVEPGSFFSEVDITIIDRLDTLFKTFSRPKQQTTSLLGQSLLTMGEQSDEFDEAMQDAGQNSNAVMLSVNCPHATLQLRFPIPDLRPSDQHAPREWWGRNLHKESLLLEVDNLSLQRNDVPEPTPSAPSTVELMYSKLEVYFQEDFNKAPILFGSIQQGSAEMGDFERPRVVIKSFPTTSTLLENLKEEAPDSDSPNGALGSMDDNGLETGNPGSTPFSMNKEFMHGTQAFDWEDQDGFGSIFEKVSPGNRDEMNQFIDLSASNTKLLVEIVAPKFLFHLKDKPFVELLYNRINNDLLLWEPQRPSPPETLMPGPSLNVQPFVKDRNLMTQSFHEGLSGTFDSDSDLDDDDDDSLTGSQTFQQQEPKYRLPSNMCIAVMIGDGKAFANTPIREEDDTVVEGCHGELLLVVKDATLFVSDGHEGDKDLRYLTFNANRAQLLHAGYVEDTKPPIKMEHLEALTPDSNRRFLHMADRIYRSEHSVPVEPLIDVGMGDCSEDMVSVAVKIKVDTLHNNKHFCVAAEVRGGTLRHEKMASGQGWIDMVMDLVNLTDYPIQGYVMPKVLTDLHIELVGCAIDYRPKNFPMPMRSLLTAQRFSLAVNLNTETKYTPLKFFLDEAKLWLSNKDYMEIRLDKDYICLAYLAMLEMGLRLGQAKEGGCHTLMWLSNSMTELRVCADSFAAFTSLIDHFMQDKDLRTPEQQVADETEMLEEMVRSIAQKSERTEEENEQVMKLIDEALNETIKEECAEEDEKGIRTVYFGNVPAGMDDPVLGMGGEGASYERHSRRELFVSETERVASCDDEEDFTIIEGPGLGIAPKNGAPAEVRFHRPSNKLLESLSKSRILRRPVTNLSAEELKTPSGWPTPVVKCLLREVNLEICFYGGSDFDPVKSGRKEKKVKEDEFVAAPREQPKLPPVTDLWRGGPNRHHDFMTKLTFSKLRLNYERYAEVEKISKRLVFLTKRIEVEDHLMVSNFNKLLYWPGYDVSADVENMVRVKLMWERPDDRYNTEDCSVLLTLVSLRLNLHQDTLIFLMNFFANVGDCTPVHEPASKRDPSPSPSHSSSKTSSHREKSTSRERAPIFSTTGVETEETTQSVTEDNLINFEEGAVGPQPSLSEQKPEPVHRIDVEPPGDPTFIKFFKMTRDTSITVDYQGTASMGKNSEDFQSMAKQFFQGIIHFEKVMLKLKAMQSHRGYAGFIKLLEALIEAWADDIKKTQMASVVGGFGPLSVFTQLARGILDFLTMPYIQYQRDGRLWRGMQKGALSLKKSAQVALLELLKKIFDSIQVCSEYCFDILSSGKSVRSYQSRLGLRQPKDIREGVSGAIAVIQEGVTGTTSDIVQTANQQREQKGLAGAVGTLAKSGPALTLFMPIAVGSAGASKILEGIRNEVNPEIKKEEEEKWKYNK